MNNLHPIMNAVNLTEFIDSIFNEDAYSGLTLQQLYQKLGNSKLVSYISKICFSYLRVRYSTLPDLTEYIDTDGSEMTIVYKGTRDNYKFILAVRIDKDPHLGSQPVKIVLSLPDTPAMSKRYGIGKEEKDVSSRLTDGIDGVFQDSLIVSVISRLLPNKSISENSADRLLATLGETKFLSRLKASFVAAVKLNYTPADYSEIDLTKTKVKHYRSSTFRVNTYMVNLTGRSTISGFRQKSNLKAGYKLVIDKVQETVSLVFDYRPDLSIAQLWLAYSFEFNPNQSSVKFEGKVYKNSIFRDIKMSPLIDLDKGLDKCLESLMNTPDVLGVKASFSKIMKKMDLNLNGNFPVL